MQALQDTYATRWPQLQMGLNALFLVVVLAVLSAIVLLSLAVDGWLPGLLYSLAPASLVGIRYSQEVRERSDLRTALAHALTQITEREPSAAAAEAVADLRSFSRDLIEQDRASRQVCAEAADRIEAATQDCRLLPLPAADGLIACECLPLPAD